MTDIISELAPTIAGEGGPRTAQHDRADATLETRIPKHGLGSPETRQEMTPSPSTTSSPAPPIFSLSNELLIEIISNLCPNDISACRQTCRQLNDLIVDSQLIQYIIRTALSGVFDPLDPGLSLPERFEALERWEKAWAEVDLRTPNARIDAPVPAGRGHPVEFSFGRYFVVIREGYARSAGYSFLDMLSTFSSHATAALWTTIKINTPNVLVFAFASELDLAVAISCVRPSLASQD
jgi:F-box domain